MKVCKFGGTSLADAVQVKKVCSVVVSDPSRRIVIVSAPGKRHKKDTKVTDLLIALAEKKLSGSDTEKELMAVVDRYREIQEETGAPADVTKEIEADLRKRLTIDHSNKARFLDTMKAAGEDNSARLVAAVFKKLGHEAHYINPADAGMLLTAEYGNAQLLPESYTKLAELKHAPGISVFPGFFGYTKDGDVVTFPRGGSDITGSIISAAVKAEVYENFTDVDSVCAVDPGIVPDVAPIPELTYREMRELSYAGFGVLHEEAIIPAVRAGVMINIRNTNNPEHPGTRIVTKRNVAHGSIVGIACGDGYVSFYIDKYLMNREIGFGRRLLQIFEDEGLSYEHSPSGIDNICVIIRDSTVKPERIDQIVSRIKKDLNPDNIQVEHDYSMIMIVGEGMQYTPGILAKAAKAFADVGVNIEIVNQGSSETSIMFGVKTKDVKISVKALYEAFFVKTSSAKS